MLGGEREEVIIGVQVVIIRIIRSIIVNSSESYGIYFLGKQTRCS